MTTDHRHPNSSYQRLHGLQVRANKQSDLCGADDGGMEFPFSVASFSPVRRATPVPAEGSGAKFCYQLGGHCKGRQAQVPVAVSS